MATPNDKQSAPLDRVVNRRQNIALLRAIQRKATEAYDEAEKISWFRIFRKGDAIERAMAWNEAWQLALDVISQDDDSSC
jgi:hypothetical protein